MLGGYKIIGVCLTKLQDETTSDYIQKLHREAITKGYRLFVFNSFLDFYKNDSYDRGAKSIYGLINYNMLDALVILDECFYDKMLVTELIEKAKEKNIPVVTVYGEYEGCYCVKKDYGETFKNLIKHVIEKHNVSDVYFLAGVKGEENSEERIRFFKEVMDSYGLLCDESVIFYGDYWEEPTKKVVDGWINSQKIPQAIICANDSMAVYVCERFNLHGISVPNDVIVTGFDGIESFDFKKPRLTTCFHNISHTAKITLEIIENAANNISQPSKYLTQYDLRLSESCGCVKEDHTNALEIAENFFHKLVNMKRQESIAYSHSEKIAGSSDWNDIQQHLSGFIMRNSHVVLNSNFLSLGRRAKFITNKNIISNKLIVFASNKNGLLDENHTEFSRHEIFPNLAEIIKAEQVFAFQSIYVEDEVCGYFFAQISDVNMESFAISRNLRTANLDFSIILNRMRQEYLNTRFESLKTRDSLTGLINLKGLTENMETNYNEYAKMSIGVSIYAIPQYKYILENYGINDIENAVSVVAEALQFANNQRAIISRISEEEFIVINLEKTPELVGEEITRSVGEFFKITEKYNSSLEKNYYIEVNCGCIVSNPGWENNLPSFIKASKGEMYLNKLKSGHNSDVVKEETTTQDYEIYKKFDLLISKNLFTYHFQPIVDAKTGEICAYEALMRTDESINLSPKEILDIAKRYKRLYDVEKATLFNVFDYIDKNRELFKGRRVFINTIPGCFLEESDYDMLKIRYGHLFRVVTIELTEQNETEDAELRQIRTLEYNNSACEIAIDDYGTGYSNIVNLLRYQPNIIKIDRYLISGVEQDANKQHFISSTIEFAKGNNILVLAEGVETKAELSKVIELGVDLVQGYLTARPKAEVITHISDEIRNLIVEESQKQVKT